MRAINHALTGTFIGLSVGRPLIAIPAALASHFICDMIPHHGSQKPNSRILRSGWFRITLAADALLCVLLVALLASQQPEYWFLAAICAFAAASPDFLFVNRFLRAQTHKKTKTSRLVQWTIDIQWFQRPIGAVVEIAWFAALSALLIPFLRQ